jgi:hypothetical protein
MRGKAVTLRSPSSVLRTFFFFGSISETASAGGRGATGAAGSAAADFEARDDADASPAGALRRGLEAPFASVFELLTLDGI